MPRRRTVSPLATPPKETYSLPTSPTVAPKSLLPEATVSEPPLSTVVPLAVPTRLEPLQPLPLKVAEPPTKSWPPELTVVLVIENPSNAVPPLRIVVPVAVPEKCKMPEMVAVPTNMMPPALTIVLFAVSPSNRTPPELIIAPLTNPPSNSTPPLKVGSIELAVPPNSKTCSVPPLMMSPKSVPAADKKPPDRTTSPISPGTDVEVCPPLMVVMAASKHVAIIRTGNRP
jgi:hypothetical protein